MKQFKILDKKQKSLTGKLSFKNVKWALSKSQSLKNKFEIGDILYVKKEKNDWKLKQYPKVNGGIVALNPFTGDVKALVGGFNCKSREFNRVTQAELWVASNYNFYSSK